MPLALFFEGPMDLPQSLFRPYTRTIFDPMRRLAAVGQVGHDAATYVGQDQPQEGSQVSMLSCSGVMGVPLSMGSNQMKFATTTPT